MQPEPTAPPPPSNPNWHRFANNVIGCKSLVDSYIAAGFKCTKATAYVNASRLRRKPVVADYIAYWVKRDYQERQKQHVKLMEEALQRHLRQCFRR